MEGIALLRGVVQKLSVTKTRPLGPRLVLKITDRILKVARTIARCCQHRVDAPDIALAHMAATRTPPRFSPARWAGG